MQRSRRRRRTAKLVPLRPGAHRSVFPIRASTTNHSGQSMSARPAPTLVEMQSFDYFAGRRRAIAERETRLSEWGYGGAHLTEDDLLLRVPGGWRPLVREISQGLVIIDPTICSSTRSTARGGCASSSCRG